MLRVDAVPHLHEAVLVVAFDGWVDAGAAGAGAAGLLDAQLEASRPFAVYELADLVDLQQTRPTVELVDGETRRVSWPEVRFVAGRAGRDVVLCTGPEPSLRWPTFTADIVGLAARVGVSLGVMLGGMPAVVSHRRPVPVLATATSASLAQEAGAMRTDYQGPTGVQTVLQVALGEAGIPAVGLWAQVPHYVAGNPSPPAVRALLERLRDVAGIRVELGDLDAESEAYLDQVEESLAERPDVTDLVRAIEAEADELPSGDDLASEIERFLRNQ